MTPRFAASHLRLYCLPIICPIKGHEAYMRINNSIKQDDRHNCNLPFGAQVDGIFPSVFRYTPRLRLAKVERGTEVERSEG